MFLTSSITGDLVTFLVTFTIILVSYWKWSYQYWRRRKVPYLAPQLPYGNFAEALTNQEHIAISQKKMYSTMKSKGWKFGGVYVLSQPTFLPIDLDLIKHILTKDFEHFPARNMYVNEKEPLQAHLANVNGDKWRILRTKLSPTFTSGKIKMMFNIMVECQRDLHKRMKKEIDKDEPINISEVLGCFTSNIIGSCAFGLEFNALEDENSAFRKYGKAIFESTRFLFLKRLFALTFPNLARFFNVYFFPVEITDFFKNLVKETVDYRENNNYSRNDFMQLLINLKDSDQKPLNMNEVASQAFVFLGAGFETSSTLMTFALYELSKNQDVQNKLRNEINTVLKKFDNKFSYEAIQDMKYLSQVVDESLRKHPPGLILSRICSKNYQVPGTDIVIEKGTPVEISVLGIHHDPEYYPDPEKFDPERFSEKNKKSRHGYAYLPFGEGPRNCIGMRFGLQQAKVGLASLIQNFRFTINKKTKDPLVYGKHGMVLTAEGGIWLNAEKIN